MITILTTTKHQQFCIDTINSVNRLNELINVNTENTKTSTKIIKIDKDTIVPTIDWNDTEVPYLFPTLKLTQKNLLTFIFYKLGNHQKAFEFVSNEDDLQMHLLIVANLQYGYPITNQQIQFLKETSRHNLAIAYNFGIVDENVAKKTLQNIYEDAIKNGKTDSEKLFTVKNYINLLLDNNLQKDAEKLVRSFITIAKSDEEKNALNILLSNSLMAQIAIPYDKIKLIEIMKLQEKSIVYLEQKKLKVNAGLLLINASEIANYQNEYIKSKDLINKAILYFKEANISEFLGEATLQKAILLYTWSKNGSPQYYKPAINTFQNALKVFKRDTHPQKFADIHHNLALIYSEIQVSEKEKPIWTAFCASSFKDAIKFYTKEQFPYQYAMISHNYATALMGFPEAKLHNNLDKAFGLFEEALAVRTAKKYPFERALTLLNQLELYWLLGNVNQKDENKKYHEMLEKTNEIFTLVDDKILLKKAKTNLEEIKKLKSYIN